MKITKSNEPIHVKSICVLIYGSPGVGKTSLGFTAESPLLLDFDRGAYRSGYRKDTVQVDTWADVADLSAAALADYSTVVVDTVGRLLDALAVNIIADNPKMRGYGGALSLQGYGALKSAYAGWLKALLAFGKDIVLVAHDKEDKAGDELLVRPDIQGGSYGEVFKRADGVAYMHKAGKDTVLDFSPTDRWVGKNAAGFNTLIVPHFGISPQYFAGVMGDIKKALNAMSEDQVKATNLIEDWRVSLADTDEETGINDAIATCNNLTPAVRAQVKRLIVDRATALGLEFDKATKSYHKRAAA